MRYLAAIVLLSLMSCFEQDLSATSQAAQEVATQNSGQQDVPLEGSEPVQEWSLGPAVEGPPVDPALLAAQEKYLDRVREAIIEWEALGLSEEEMIERMQEIKAEELGE